MSDIILFTASILVGLGTVIFFVFKITRRQSMAGAADELHSVAKRLKSDTSPERMRQCSSPRQLECSSGDKPSTSSIVAKRETPVSIIIYEAVTALRLIKLYIMIISDVICRGA